jgi:hypothetical protein
VLRSVERHVLHEVSQAELIVVFEQRACVDGQPQGCTLLWLAMFENVVRQAIVELAGTHCRVHRGWGF